MWFGQGSPWMQGGPMGQQQGMTPGMTPGAGMPPVGQGNAPMSMQRPQMGPPGQVPPAPMGGMGQQQQPMNPAQMGMLSQMLAQQTRPPGGPPPSAAATAGLPGAAAAQMPTTPGQGASAALGANPIGMLFPWLGMGYGPQG